MLTVYVPHNQCLSKLEIDAQESLPHQAVWLDLLNPSREEELKVERALKIEVPTREEMQEIEATSRLYDENGATYMTATIMSRLNADEVAVSGPVTFVLAKEKLLTIRYTDPRPFSAFTIRSLRMGSGYVAGPQVMMGLLEAVIDRLADVLEQVGSEIDGISHNIFDPGAHRVRSHTFQRILRKLGRKGELGTKARESLVSIARLVHYLRETIDFDQFSYGKDLASRGKAMDDDISSLLNHVDHLGIRINFLLDATLGFINIEQNAIIKIFSMVTIALMPPTLIGAVYGMNFKFMPELEQWWGYPFAIVLMLISAFVPFIYFRRRGWL